MPRPPPVTPAPPASRGRFALTRYYSLTSLVGIALVTACLFWTYRELALRQIIEHENRANADLTRAFSNSVWSRYRDFVLTSEGRPAEALVADPMHKRLHADVLEKMHGLQIVKVKVYNLDGLTVYSTDERQIGENKRGNAGFQAARAGRVDSQITYREKFDALEGVINNRNLIASYVPIRAEANMPVEGVFEVYSDVTPLLQQQSRAQWQVAGVVLSLLATLYLFLFFVVRKADRIIAAQDAERAAREEQIRHQAFHDALTGLPNRACFAERWSETIALASRHGRACALMFVDLDRFKKVNDTLGHSAGDQLLRVVAQRMQTCLRDSDIIFRMGGDEFTVILPEIEAPDDAAAVARRIHEAVERPVPLLEQQVSVGATIGITVYPSDGDTAEALLRNADAAMYVAKQGGRGRHVFFATAAAEPRPAEAAEPA